MTRLREAIDAKKQRMIAELLKGKDTATRLQALLQSPVRDKEDRVLFEELALQIWTSFSVPLALFESNKNLAVKDRRGCYKRRKTGDSWVKVSKMGEDGRAWRKYGQKEITSSPYPRCYYRCTNKYQGCNATKQVQRINETPLLYQTTYFNQHTCTETDPTEIIVDLEPVEPNLISFKITVDQSNESVQNLATAIIAPLSKDTHTGDIRGADSSLDQCWQDTMIKGSNNPMFSPILINSYQHEDASSLQFGPTSLYGFDDMEVDQLGNIDNLQFLL